MALSHNLEKSTIYVNSFKTGLYTQRGPVFVPLSMSGIQAVQRLDTLWDGLNMDVTHTMTLARRPGFTRFGSGQLGVGEHAQAFFSFKNTSGTIHTLFESATKVATFTSGAGSASVIPKHTTKQGSMSKVGDMFYYCDGDYRDLLKWDGTNLWKWGIDAPVLAPTISFNTGTLTSTNGGYQYLFVYKNSHTFHISSSSPLSAATLDVTNQNITISGEGSSDPQVDQIEIYRTEDGGGIFYYLTTLSMTPTWTFTDTYTDEQLNTFIVVTPGLGNSPPPLNAHLACFHQGRYFLAADSDLYISGGPDITNGVPEECFAPGNVLRFPGKITCLAATTGGLVVFTAADLYAILGQDTYSYYPKLIQKNFGVATQNSVVQDGDTLIMYTSQRQLFTLADMSQVGYPIGDRLFQFDPTTTYLALHRNGPDEGLFVSNGVDTVYHYSVSLNAWSTAYGLVGGCGAISSIETSSANYTLLLANNGVNLLQRDITTFSDDGAAYACYATVGTIPLIGPGQSVAIDSIIVNASPVGAYPQVSIRINEIAGDYTPLPNPEHEPAPIPPSTSMIVMKHYLSQADIAREFARTMQIRFDFIAEEAASEIYELAILPGEATQ